LEDVTAWLAQQMAKTPSAGLLRLAWDTVGRIVARVVADHLDERRLSGLIAIGCDEISYRRGQRYLTTVVDHHAGAIVWCAPGRNAQTLQAFFDELGPERAKTIRAVSIDMSGGYEKAIRDNLPPPRSASTRSTSSAWASAPSTRSVATSGTPTSAHTPRPASGSRAPAGRC
jgi:transposase